MYSAFSVADITPDSHTTPNATNQLQYCALDSTNVGYECNFAVRSCTGLVSAYVLISLISSPPLSPCSADDCTSSRMLNSFTFT